MIKISVDAMSGDYGPCVTVPAALDVLEQSSQTVLILVGREKDIEKYIPSEFSDSSRIQIRHATEVVKMDDVPAYALRKKKDSSMRVALDLLRLGEVDACVSAGNTGALMSTARFVLKTLKGIERPAICAQLPRVSGYTSVLDLGANVSSSALVLYQFGVMGAALALCLDARSIPTVGILNIGTEEMKGGSVIQEAAKLMKDSNLNYIGFVEADKILTGDVDVVVCDGFAGNVALKSIEGTAQMIMSTIKEEFTKNTMTKIIGGVAKPIISSVRHRLDHRRYNGASLLGLNGTVVKSHGGADRFAFKHAILVASQEASNNIVQKITESLTVEYA